MLFWWAFLRWNLIITASERHSRSYPTTAARQHGSHTPRYGSRRLATTAQLHGTETVSKMFNSLHRLALISAFRVSRQTPTCLSKVKRRPISDTTSDARRWLATTLSTRASVKEMTLDTCQNANIAPCEAHTSSCCWMDRGCGSGGFATLMRISSPLSLFRKFLRQQPVIVAISFKCYIAAELKQPLCVADLDAKQGFPATKLECSSPGPSSLEA